MKNKKEYWHALSDPAIMQKLGEYIHHNRLEQNKTQQEISMAAGVNRSTLVQVEKGKGGTLLSLIQIIRALEKLEIFESFEVVQQFSPLQLAKLEHKKRQRASAKPSSDSESPKSDW
jgi:transcriptional regulator with XRE-family HTH domain